MPGKYFPDACAHLVVHFANSAYEMADEFTCNTFPFWFTIPPAYWIPQFLGQDLTYFTVAACRTQSAHFWAQMLYNLCQPNLSTVHHLQHLHSHLPQVPAKAARTVRPKDLLTETYVPIGRTLRQDLFWKYGRTASLLVKEETVAHGAPLRRSLTTSLKSRKFQASTLACRANPE